MEQKSQLNEWVEKVKAYLTIHIVNIEDYMDEPGRSVETINIKNVQNVYTATAGDVAQLQQRFPTMPQRMMRWKSTLTCR
eukprot:4538812-Amphidinium_carterae.3